MAKQTDILLGNLEDAIPVDKQGGRPRGPGQGREGGRLRRHRALDAGQLAREPLGARRPHHAGHRDRRQARGDHGPEGRGRLGHPLRRPPARPARGEGRSSSGRSSSTRSSRPSLGVVNLEEIATASPRMQGMSFGPADLAASRRMKTTRVGGGHPGYRVIEDPDPDNPEAPRATAQQDPWHYSIARMVDACTSAGILPFYGPYGDIKDTAGLRDPVPRRLPARLRRRLVAAPGPDRDREEGLQPAPGGGQVRQEGARGDPRRPRRPHDRRQDAGRRDLEAVQGDGRRWPRCSPRRTRSWRRPTSSERAAEPGPPSDAGPATSECDERSSSTATTWLDSTLTSPSSATGRSAPRRVRCKRIGGHRRRPRHTYLYAGTELALLRRGDLSSRW